jgi:hypothetical protein
MMTGQLPRLHICWCITAGRTGTTYLYQLLRQNIPDCHAYHERAGNATLFGVQALDISHITEFNMVGLTENVKAFWITKFSLILDELMQNDRTHYIETSHLLWKGGLLEACNKMSRRFLDWHFVILKRDFLKTIISYYNRYDFYTTADIWIWYLDPKYKLNVVPVKEFTDYIGKDHTTEDFAWALRLWYCHEVRARQMLYREKYKDKFKFYTCSVGDLNTPEGVAPLLKWLDVEPPEEIVIPPRQNVTKKKRRLTAKRRKWLKDFVEAME